ncbi:hypothetical protein [Pseudomonas typographi]|uniref:Outer membrane protein H1 n=1 Tax=Pseudomonas typographi TaxID=2715964 RepID=A0ABR7Z9D2_9PSED|nr:hypothetical protein [Pseudomonas typographi]MBD1587418.1 hypothetical protein [Pseudomonas typographi]MBD1601941.1 hypothetical protein [Pseudomonas typographi]
MKTLQSLLLATAFVGATTQAMAATTDFAGLTYGETRDKFDKSRPLNANLGDPHTDGVIKHEGNWGVRAGQQNDQGRYYATYEYTAGSHQGLKLRQQNLLGSYDLFYPLGNSTKLFGGGTLGLTELTQKSAGYRHDSATGYAVGAQAGILQHVSQNTSVELGYRYLRSNAKVDFDQSGGSKQGSLQLNSSAQTYLAANYQF